MGSESSSGGRPDADGRARAVGPEPRVTEPAGRGSRRATRWIDRAGFEVVRALAAFLVRLFYRDVEVVGIEHVPSGGPLIVAANHQNALVDPLVVLATLPRRLWPVAKAPLFRNPLVGPFLRLVGAIPIHRALDAEGQPTSNVTAFRAVAARFRAGEAILVFPEGVSQPEPRLMPLRTGVARMLLGAGEASMRGGDDTLVPVGLLYDEPGRFRAGRALVLVGPPVPTADCVGWAGADGRRAVRELTGRLAAAIRALVIEAGDRETLRLLRVAEGIWREEAAAERVSRADSAAWLQAAARAYRWLRDRAPDRVERLRRDVERYASDLERTGLGDARLDRRYPVRVVARYAVQEGLALLAGVPLALLGVAMHGLPYRLTALATRLARPEPDTEATVKLAAGTVLYPAAWLVEAAVAWRLGGGWALGLFGAALLPGGFFALAWRERLDRVRKDARALLSVLADGDLAARLAARRRALRRELEALTELVPAPVLDGDGGARGSGGLRDGP